MVDFCKPDFHADIQIPKGKRRFFEKSASAMATDFCPDLGSNLAPFWHQKPSKIDQKSNPNRNQNFDRFLHRFWCHFGSILGSKMGPFSDFCRKMRLQRPPEPGSRRGASGALLKSLRGDPPGGLPDLPGTLRGASEEPPGASGDPPGASRDPPGTLREASGEPPVRIFCPGGLREAVE